MDIKVKWFYRLGFLLLLLIVLFVFIKLNSIWQPILQVTIKSLLPFLVGAFIAYLLAPFVNQLQRNGLQRWLSVLIIYLLFFGGIGYAIYKGIPAFVQQLKDLSENFPILIEQYEKWAQAIETETKSWPLGIHNRIDESIHGLNKGLENFIERILNFLFWVVDSFVLIILIPFITFYIIKDLDHLKKTFWAFIPEKWQEQVHRFLVNVDQSLGNYIRGQLIVCATIGAISAALFWLIKLKYPLLLGAVIGLTNVIPYFGPIIGAIPVVAIAATSSVQTVIFVIIIVIGLQFLEGNILMPLIYGKTLQMHPLLIMFSILIGGEIGGVIGLIIAVPTVAIIKTAIRQAYEQFRKKEQ